MKTIVILRPKPKITLQTIAEMLPREEPVLWNYFASGVCRAAHYDRDAPGVVLLEFETTTAEEVAGLVGAFPLVSEGAMTPEFHYLAPYTGLALLFDPGHGFHPTPPDSWRAG